MSECVGGWVFHHVERMNVVWIVVQLDILPCRSVKASTVLQILQELQEHFIVTDHTHLTQISNSLDGAPSGRSL